jgi:hypothetical protein
MPIPTRRGSPLPPPEGHDAARSQSGVGLFGFDGTSRVGRPPNANLPAGQGGAPATEDVAGPATKRVNATASILPDAMEGGYGTRRCEIFRNSDLDTAEYVGGPNRAVPLPVRGLD